MKRWVAAALMLMLLATGVAEEAARELSAYLGQDIEEAAKEIGALTLSTSDEFEVNYSDAGLSLHGNGGKVQFIELRNAAGECAIKGVSTGMTREAVDARLSGLPELWRYDEEVAYSVEQDGGHAMFVIFYENGTVSGAWYRADG